jgi:ABC-type uncharacterized transport system permease subunit
VVGIALGFAVIPVIFTIAEDALSAVPRSLTSAALALGASRWQSALHVVLPAASPGIFAAVMLGLGRAVGETMIVLMATGITPILDLSPFNGMRTMSAGIAVEIPEAPHAGTLYRVLFLTGFLLFSFTFVLKTSPAAVLLRKAAGIEKGSGVPNKDKVGKVTRKQVREIAELKMKDLNAVDLEGAMRQIEGTARNMGLTVEE